MPLLVTPGHLSHRAELYHQLGQLTRAGIGLVQALETEQRAPPSRAFRAPLGRILTQLQSGSTFSEATRDAGDWMPVFDRALLEAGEKSGRLPECFQLLSSHYESRAQLARQVIHDLMYPAFLFHFAVLIGPLPSLVVGGTIGSYLRSVGMILVPVYAITFALLYASQSRRGEMWRSVIERVTGAIPLVGRAQRNLALARLSAALEALINAGVSIIDAWELAGAASGSPALRRVTAGWRSRLENGDTPARLVAQSREFPELFSNLYHTGEISGGLDHSLKKLHELYADTSSRQMRAISQWVPRLIYFAIVGMIAYRVLTFWMNYFGKIGEAIAF